MAYQSMTKTLPIQCHLMPLRKRHGWLNTKRFRMRLSQLFEKMATQPTKGEGRYIHGKLKTGKECRQIFMVKTFHMTCIAM